jgi:alkylresorcinol/alkylpyrone synthase
MTNPPRLLATATAVPPHVLRQHEVAAAARHWFAGYAGDLERMLPVFLNAGIETRYSCVPLEWYAEPAGWRESNRLYIENAVDLLAEAAESCLADAGIDAAEVDAIVTVSTSGIATPGLDARLMARLAFRAEVQRLPVFGLGCAGGVLGLGRAAALATAAPASKILLLVVELCGLTFRAGDRSKSNIVAAALFGDGAAAALVSCDPDAAGPAITAWGEHTWPNSLEVMGWRVQDDGFGVLFSRDIPALIRTHFGAALDAFLARHGLARDDLDGYICHPGGAKVIAALEAALGLPPGAMAEARAVLRDFGNISAASVMFLLDRRLRQGLRGRHLVSALGPGFTAGFLTLDAS